MKVADSIFALIGKTPMVKLNRLVGKADADLYLKLEYFNPGGSVKDRIALSMIQGAEARGVLKPGATILEPTSGNTGIGLAMVAAAKGYRALLVMPDTMSMERRNLLQAYGAELVLTPGSEGMQGAIAKAEEILQKNPNYFMPQQFNNMDNVRIHFEATAQEIIDQIGDSLDAFVTGVGTGGTITGVGMALRIRFPRLLIIAVEPEASPVLSGGRPGPHKIEGIGAGFFPEILDRTIYDEIIQVSNEDSFACARRLAKEEGILGGISTGASTVAAMKISRRLGLGKKVVTIAASNGERYLTSPLYQF
jgi:cysteine synthase A